MRVKKNAIYLTGKRVLFFKKRAGKAQNPPETAWCKTQLLIIRTNIYDAEFSFPE